MKNEGLTIEKLRELTGKNYTDEEAEEVISSIKKLVSIIMEIPVEQTKSAVSEVSNQEQQVKCFPCVPQKILKSKKRK